MDGGPQERARAIEFKEMLKRRPRRKHQAVTTHRAPNSVISDHNSSTSSSAKKNVSDTHQTEDSAADEMSTDVFIPEMTFATPVSAVSSTNLDAMLSKNDSDIHDSSSDQIESTITPLTSFNAFQASLDSYSMSIDKARVIVELDNPISTQAFDDMASISPVSITRLDKQNSSPATSTSQPRSITEETWRQDEPIGADQTMSMDIHLQIFRCLNGEMLIYSRLPGCDFFELLPAIARALLLPLSWSAQYS